MSEDFFGGSDLPADVNLTIAPPQRYPGKTEIDSLRYALTKKLCEAYGAVEAYIMLKLFDKLINDDDKSKNGVFDQLKEQVKNELIAAGGKMNVKGAAISWSNWRKAYIFPPEVVELQEKLQALEQQLTENVETFKLDREIALGLPTLREQVKIEEQTAILRKTAVEGDSKKVIKVNFK